MGHSQAACCSLQTCCSMGMQLLQCPVQSFGALVFGHSMSELSFPVACCAPDAVMVGGLSFRQLAPMQVCLLLVQATTVFQSYDWACLPVVRTAPSQAVAQARTKQLGRPLHVVVPVAPLLG